MGNGAQQGQDVFGDFAVQANDSQRFGAQDGFAAAHGKGGDVHAFFAEQGAHLADDAGDVAVFDEQEGSFERGFDVDSIDAQKSGRASIENGAFGDDLISFASAGGENGDLHQVDNAAVVAGPGGLFDGQAALGGAGRSVDQIDVFGEHAIEDTGQGGAANDVGSEFGGLAGARHAHTGDGEGGGLSGEGSDPLGQLEIRPQLAVLFGRNGGEVYGVTEDAVGQVIADLLGDLHSDFFLGLGGGAGDVGSGDDVVHRQQGRIDGGFDGKDIKSGAGQMSGTEGLGERGFIHQFAAGGVYQARAALHLGNGIGIDHFFGGRRERGVEGNVVGLGEHFRQGQQFDAPFGGAFRGQVGVIGQNAHFQGARPARNFDADAAQADQAEGFAAQFFAGGGGFFPSAGVQSSVQLRDGAGHGKHERQGVFGDTGGIAAGRIDHQDAAAGGGIEFDVVHTNSGASYDAEFGRAAEQGVGDAGGAADNQGVGVRNFAVQFGATGLRYLPAGVGEQGNATRTDLVGDDNFHFRLLGSAKQRRTASRACTPAEKRSGAALRCQIKPGDCRGNGERVDRPAKLPLHSDGVKSSAGLGRIPETVLLLLLTLAAIGIHGYHYGVQDQCIYLPAIKQHVDPSLYPHDRAFFALQTRVMLTDELVAYFMRATHLPADWAVFLWQLLSIWLLLGGCLQVARRCFAGRGAQWAATAAVASMFTLAVGGTLLFVADEYFHPRTLATALLLFALAALLDGKYAAAGAGVTAAAAFHPTMAAAGALHLAVAGWRQPGWKKLGPASAVIALPLLGGGNPAWREALASHGSLYYPLRWPWYAWLSFVVPVALLAWFKGLERGKASPAGYLSGRLMMSASMGVLAGIVVSSTPGLEGLIPLEPMRTLHFFTVVTILLGGGFLEERFLHGRAGRWAAVFVPLAAAQFIPQLLILYPHSPHIEWPGRTARNEWTEAFQWVRENTPKDAYFVLNPRYQEIAGEDFHDFRGVAERSALADFSKDHNVATNWPELAPVWSEQYHDHENWAGFGLADFERLKEKYGISWAVIESSNRAAPELNCPYRNAALRVCRIP